MTILLSASLWGLMALEFSGTAHIVQDSTIIELNREFQVTSTPGASSDLLESAFVVSEVAKQP